MFESSECCRVVLVVILKHFTNLGDGYEVFVVAIHRRAGQWVHHLSDEGKAKEQPEKSKEEEAKSKLGRPKTKLWFIPNMQILGC